MCTHMSTGLTASLFLESLKLAVLFTREALPSQRGPAFQNSLLGNLKAAVKGKYSIGPICSWPPALTMHTLNTKKGFHKSL